MPRSRGALDRTPAALLESGADHQRPARGDIALAAAGGERECESRGAIYQASQSCMLNAFSTMEVESKRDLYTYQTYYYCTSCYLKDLMHIKIFVLNFIFHMVNIVPIQNCKGSPVHVAPAYVVSENGSDHFESLRNFFLHLCKRLFPPKNVWFQNLTTPAGPELLS
jgi:hypothetical protein